MSTPVTTQRPLSAQAALCIGALGVVFGDIGTSPLYTMKECRDNLPAGVGLTDGVLGILSLILWTLILVVTIKYLFFVTRADNQGEGGIFALLALLHGSSRPSGKHAMGASVVMILIGAALLYGDGIITPAISVLGAAEGFLMIHEGMKPYVVAIACGVLAALFWIQHKGTHRLGAMFGPVMLVWFAVLGGLGLWHIVGNPAVWHAVNPLHGWRLLQHRPVEISALLGAVVLAITGAEALYADMGHFGRRYIAIAWYGAAFPALALNYFGQGAYILGHVDSTENPFFALAPSGWPRIALTGLSIAAAVIASQALISGAFSLTRQAIQLGYFPRLRVVHTHAEHSGQIYVPLVNWLLAIGSILTVASFGTTTNLAAAYGIAVTGTMAITTVAYYLVTRQVGWPVGWLAVLVCAIFFTVDAAFFGANLHKIAEGGWFPLAIGAAVLAVMHTWRAGRAEIFQRVYRNSVTDPELAGIARSPRVTRVRGAAVFMAGSPSGTPVALLHHLKSNRSLHQTVLLLSIVTEEVPTVEEANQLAVSEVGEGIWRVVGRYGYMQSPNAAELLERVRARGVKIDPATATYFFNREMVMGGGVAEMWDWQKGLYGFLSRNATPAKDYFQIPPSQIIEVGLPVQL